MTHRAGRGRWGRAVLLVIVVTLGLMAAHRPAVAQPGSDPAALDTQAATLAKQLRAPGAIGPHWCGRRPCWPGSACCRPAAG